MEDKIEKIKSIEKRRFWETKIYIRYIYFKLRIIRQ
jgi:hypothetical protein